MNTFSKFVAPPVPTDIDADTNVKETEIPTRVAYVDLSLDNLETAILTLTERLAPVMSVEVGKADQRGGEIVSPVCSTPLGTKLSGQEARIRHATDVVQSILIRLEI